MVFPTLSPPVMMSSKMSTPEKYPPPFLQGGGKGSPEGALAVEGGNLLSPVAPRIMIRVVRWGTWLASLGVVLPTCLHPGMYFA